MVISPKSRTISLLDFPQWVITTVVQSRHVSWLLLPLWILTISSSAFAHGGHGNEFGGQDGAKSTSVQIDGITAQQIGVQTVAAKKQSLNVEISATGQIELLPSQKVEVTAPVKGKLVQLLVQPGARVKAGQILARMSSPELNELRASSLEKRSAAVALLQQAQTDRNLGYSRDTCKIGHVTKNC